MPAFPRIVLVCVVVALCVLVVCQTVVPFAAIDKFGNYHPFRHGFNNINSNLLANHKVATSRMLQLNDVPCPRFVHVYRRRKTAAHTHRLLDAYDIAYPVVVKPVNGTQGARVVVNLRTADDVHAAIDQSLPARKRGKPIGGLIVEEQVDGDDFRVLLLNHRVHDIVCRVRATVTGDGVRTVQELIDRRNEKQKRSGRFPTKSVSWAYLAEQLGWDGFDPLHNDDVHDLRTHVPTAHQRLTITNVANNHNGCNPVRVPLDSVHPDNLALFEKVSRLFRLRMTGLDYMTPDIARSWREMGHIIEVNSGPGMKVHRSAYPRDTRVTRKFIRALVQSAPRSPYEE